MRGDLTPRLGKGFTNVSPGASRREPRRVAERCEENFGVENYYTILMLWVMRGGFMRGASAER